jgi:flagellar biosynthesis chaperone FliJ
LKTKFSAVVKIKKKIVDDIQNSIFMIDIEISKTTVLLRETKDRYNTLKPPAEGPFSSLIVFEDMKKAFRYEIDTIKGNLADQQNLKNMLIGTLKEANAEYEKMKYLEEEEIKKVLKARAQQESKELDEIGVMLFNNRSAE